MVEQGGGFTVSESRGSPTTPVLTPPSPSASIWRFGDYELLGEIGRGGMGVVWKARQLSLGRLVALKMIRAGSLASASQIERFALEAKATAVLTNDHIVRIYDAGEIEGQVYYSMALIEGGELRSELARLTGAPFPLDRAACIMATVARAVHDAHAHGILHRDLNPRNILLDRQGKPYITDFGLAKFLPHVGTTADTAIIDAGPSDDFASSDGLTRPGQGMGSTGYTSPEQGGGRLEDITTATDVFSLGAILYHLITGQSPFPSGDWAEAVTRAAAGRYHRPSKLNPLVDADLDAICARCLEPDVKGRATSAASLADQLDRWRNQEPLDPSWRKTPTHERLRKWVQRHRTGAALIASLLVLLGLLFSVEVVRRESSRRQITAQENKMRELVSRADSELLHGDAHTGLRLLAQILHDYPGEHEPAEWLINLLRQRIFFFPVSPQTRGLRQVDIQAEFRQARSADGALRAAASNDVIELEHVPGKKRSWRAHADTIRNIAFSRDGRFLASASDDRFVCVWDVEMTNCIRRLEHPAGVHCVRFNPSGDRIITGCQDGRARLWNTQTGEPDGETFLINSPVATVNFSSSGAWIISTSDAGFVQIWDVSTGRPVTEPLLVSHIVDARFAANDRALVFETENGGEQSFRLTRTVPLTHANASERPQRVLVLPQPITIVLGIPATNFHSEDITCTNLSPAGNLLATSSTDFTVRVWDTRTLRPVTSPIRHSDIVNCARFAPNGAMLVSSTADNKVRAWEALTGLPLTDWLVFSEPVAAVAFSADGKRVVTDSGWSWEVHVLTGKVPRWLPQLAELLVAPADPSSFERLSELRRKLADLTDPEAAWAKRLLDMP
jgi:serine/threonine protein kinase/WD40 repeat protein